MGDSVIGNLFNYNNTGFLHEYQFINVPDFESKGEYCPTPYYYQNLAEAEYIVATYMFMCLVGYNPETITILTTYKGQKALIKDIVKQKCSWHPLFKAPRKITTVDKYQGQQNDYILLSLVRTNYIGHIRDVRRLIVAMSRGRLGLYIFGRWDLFNNCFELNNTFENLRKRPLDLKILINEQYPTRRTPNNTALFDPKLVITVEDFKHMYRIVQEILRIKALMQQINN